MAYRDNRKKSSFINSVGYALKGIQSSFNERNCKIHYCISTLVLLFGFVCKLNAIEWLFVLSCIAGMIALEMVNTAIENVVDLITSDYHALAKKAKDLAAGAVLIFAVYSVIVGVTIFLPKLWAMIGT